MDGDDLVRYRLSAYEYDEVEEKAMYLAAYVAFSHRCPKRRAKPSVSVG